VLRNTSGEVAGICNFHVRRSIIVVRLGLSAGSSTPAKMFLGKMLRASSIGFFGVCVGVGQQNRVTLPATGQSCHGPLK